MRSERVEKATEEFAKAIAGIIKEEFQSFNESMEKVKQISGKQDDLAPGTIAKHKDVGEFIIIEKPHEDVKNAYWFTNGQFGRSKNLEVITPIDKPAQADDKIIVTHDKGLHEIGEVLTVKSLFGDNGGVKVKDFDVGLHPYQFEIIERPEKSFNLHDVVWTPCDRIGVIKSYDSKDKFYEVYAGCDAPLYIKAEDLDLVCPVNERHDL